MKKLGFVLGFMFLVSAAFAAPFQTATAIVKLTQTAVAIPYATQTAVAEMTRTTNAAATATAYANARATLTQIAILTTSPTFTRTITNTVTETTVCSPTPTFTSDTRTHLAQTQTAVTGYYQTKTVEAGYSKTFTPTVTETITPTGTSTDTPEPTISPTIGLTMTSWGVNEVGLKWNAPSYSTGGWIKVNGDYSRSAFALNPKSPTNLTATASMSLGKNIIQAVSRWWDNSFGVGITLTSVSSPITIYNTSGIEAADAINKLSTAGLIVSEIYSSTATAGYSFVTKYATDRALFKTRATGPTATTIQIYTGGTATGGGSMMTMGSFAANSVLEMIPINGVYVIPSGTWIKISISAAAANDLKQIEWINCDLADYAKLKP